MLAADIIGLNPWLAVVSVAIVFIGSALQASIGVGLGLLAAPTLGLIDPDFIPGALTVSVVPLTLGMVVREHGHIDHTGIWRASIGRLVGVLLGTWLVATTGETAIAIVIGVTVLFAVAASVTGLHFAPTRRNILIAGTASGFTGASAGVGGPPMALTYQHADPRILRGTLAAFNLLGSAMTIPSLALAGVIGEREVQLALMLIPGVLGGLWAGGLTIGRLPPSQVRPFVLVACSASAIVLLFRQLV
ncbi:MAG: sulfite exporter TauE/SafE family protein [Ilumatobacteraceae bacterium]